MAPPLPFCVTDWRLHRVKRSKKLRSKTRSKLSVRLHPANMSDKKKAVWFKTTELIASNGSNGYYFRPCHPASIYYKLNKGVNIKWINKIKALPVNDPLRLAFDFKNRIWKDSTYELFWFIRVAYQHSNSGIESKNLNLEKQSDHEKQLNNYPLQKVLYSVTASRLFTMFPELHDRVFEHYELKEEKDDLIDTLKVNESILVLHPDADVGKSEDEADDI